MMLTDVALRKSYSSDATDILESFYVPALQASVRYSRLAGFFSSGSLAVAARGIAGLIRNGGSIRLVVAPRLSTADVEAILSATQSPIECVAKRMLADLDELEGELIRDHVMALGWMVANQRLAIKTALVTDDIGSPLAAPDVDRTGLFHQKVGILIDSANNAVSFSGSVNETAAGWRDNIEQFKVFRNWEPIEQEYFEEDSRTFDRFWHDQSPRAKVIDIPSAVKQRLIEMSPERIEDLRLLKAHGKGGPTRIQLYDYQRTAVTNWISHGMRGIFEMATGTGKTFTALGCIREAWRKGIHLAVVACPYAHLVQQWQGDISKFGTEYDRLVVAHSATQGWKQAFANALLDERIGHAHKVLVLTTHDTVSSHSFIDLLRSNPPAGGRLLVADEVHGLGSPKQKESLIDEYRARLGLSATPARWFDLEGTDAIRSYFGGTVYEFTLHDAITKTNPATDQSYLTPFRYRPVFVSLADEELDEYVELTRAIVRRRPGSDSDARRAELFELLLYARANLIKGAKLKLPALEGLLDEMGLQMQWTLIYCDPQLIDSVGQTLGRRGIVAHKFTMDEGIRPEKAYAGKSERAYLLDKFAEGQFQVLTAMKCLDEGVDVPPARTAVLMSSSKNPREYIQRIGRVIRRYPGKREAMIYDMIVAPEIGTMPPEFRAMELRIFESEMKRCEEVSHEAVNSVEALRAIYDVKNRLL